jgi:hypothetical protein
MLLFYLIRGGSGAVTFGLCFEAYVPQAADLVVVELTPNDSQMPVADKILSGWLPKPWPNQLETEKR